MRKKENDRKRKIQRKLKKYGLTAVIKAKRTRTT